MIWHCLIYSYDKRVIYGLSYQLQSATTLDYLGILNNIFANAPHSARQRLVALLRVPAGSRVAHAYASRASFVAGCAVPCAGSVSQTRMQPSVGGLPAGAVVPTAASLEALEAMEAGLPPPSGGAADGSDGGLAGAAGGKRPRRFRGWRGAGLMVTQHRCCHASMPAVHLSNGSMLEEIHFHSGVISSGFGSESRAALLAAIFTKAGFLQFSSVTCA